MIPIQLTLQGLYSYQEKQTIDFTKLTAANLFGIFGSVGSGKSSILEAITFAIYGRTDRLNLSGDNRYYNMMNLKSNELLIEFVFETGKNQTTYRASVKGRRNSKNFDDVKALDRSAYQKTNGEWIPISVESLESAIGLSYDNFKRTIIIPQGQFQEFLQLGNKDRTQMMKELFNLGKFEFYYKVASLESKNNAQKQNIDGQLLQLGAVDPEQVKVHQEQLSQLGKEIEKNSLRLTEQGKAEEQLRQLQELTKKRAEAGKTLSELQQQATVYDALETKITRYEQCVLGFKHVLDSLQSGTRRLEDRNRQIKLDSGQLKLKEEEIARLKQSLEALKPQYEKRTELKQKADELTLLLQMKDLEKQLVSENERLKKGKEAFSDTSDKADKLKVQKQQLEERLKLHRQKLSDLDVLAQVKAWYVEKHNIDKQLRELDKEIEKYKREEQINRQDRSKLLTLPVVETLSRDAEPDVYLPFIQQKTSENKAKLKVLEEQANHIQVKAQLKTYAEDLEDGKACPLCGAVHHPELFNADDIAEALAKLAKERDACEQQLEQLAKVAQSLNLLESQRQFTLRHLNELSEKKALQQKAMAAHAALFCWEKFRDETELTKASLEVSRIQQVLKKDESELEQLAKELTQAEKNKERYQAELEKIKTSQTIRETELKTIGQQLKIVVPAQYQQTQLPELEAEKAGLLQRFARIEKEVAEKTETLAERSKQKDTLSGSLLVNRKELEQDEQQIKELNKQLQEQLAKTAYESAEEVRRVLAEPMDLEREKKRLAQFNDSLVRSKSQVEQLQKEIGDRVYDSEAHQKMLREIAERNALLKQQNQELGKTQELLKKLQKDLESQAVLRKELEKLELRAENIKTMKSLFKASGFVNYISSVYLQNLCHSANDRFFQLTRQKLSLEITPDNSFQVRDFMNGGKVRSVKTLSGGQTFQAALSLALALADNIQKITESNQNFFFLDEGFGSLDKESLTVVFETLKSLRKENRIVGVISHVEEMQQEIDVHLRIDNHIEKGSLIYSNWNE
ncbi:AAA family ATPase [Mangrovibacterium sp.]|uniref:AAA family ATPase n=1 Tax=Mangrovibacterium sp. TaxID=1961364 RepID=UPI0035626FE0